MNACAPRAVLRPASTEDVAAILRECQSARQRVVVQGGLTGLAGRASVLMCPVRKTRTSDRPPDCS